MYNEYIDKELEVGDVLVCITSYKSRNTHYNGINIVYYGGKLQNKHIVIPFNQTFQVAGDKQWSVFTNYSAVIPWDNFDAPFDKESMDFYLTNFKPEIYT